MRVLAAGIVTGTYTDTRHIIQTRTNPVPAEGTCVNGFECLSGPPRILYRFHFVSRRSERAPYCPEGSQSMQSTLFGECDSCPHQGVITGRSSMSALLWLA